MTSPAAEDRNLFGSDFPNLPYPREDEREGLWRRALPMPVPGKIFRHNAACLRGR